MFWLNATLSKVMLGKAKICKIVPKLIKNMQNCAKTSPFSARKQLFCLKKNGQNRRFDLWKCTGSGCVWKHPGWILSVFIHIRQYVDGFLSFFCATFDIWAILAQKRALLGQKWHHLGSFRVDSADQFASFWHPFDDSGLPFWLAIQIIKQLFFLALFPLFAKWQLLRNLCSRHAHTWAMEHIRTGQSRLM